MWKYAAVGLVLLSACGPRIPESGASLDGRPVDIGRGVGFGSYSEYESARIERERVLRSGGTGAVPVSPTGPVISDEAVADAGQAQVISSDELSAAGIPVAPANGAVIPAPEPIAGAPLDARGSGGPAIAPAPGAAIANAQPVDINNPGISDEQSFDAVAARETIESDAQRLERQRQAYQVIQPTPVPTRNGSAGPNIVQYALTTTNSVGQRIYSRSGINGANRAARACGRYPSPDLAQTEFLERGGPERDRLGLDPDGDGFACSWDPGPFRAARG